MNQSSFDHIVKLVERNERDLSEIRQNLSEVERSLNALIDRVDFLVDQSVAPNQPIAETFEVNSFEISDNFCLTQALPPRTAPASMVYRDGVWASPSPSTPRVFPNPLPAMIPSNEVQGYEVYDGENDYGEENVHLHTEERMNVSTRMAEISTSMAVAKPKRIENNVKSESNSPVASSSGSGYDRARNTEKRTLRLAQICEALSITRTGDELSTLQAIIKSMGGRVPNVEESTGGMAGANQERGSRKRREIRACFEALQGLVGPPVDKLAYNKVLDDILTKVTTQVDEPPPDDGRLYKVFRLDNW